MFEEFLILEKKISQIKSYIEIEFDFEVIKTKHATKRQMIDKSDTEQRYISNSELVEFIHGFKEDIARSIAIGKIKHRNDFILRSFERNITLVIIPVLIKELNWKLIIKTVYRESEENPFRVGDHQLILE